MTVFHSKSARVNRETMIKTAPVILLKDGVKNRVIWADEIDDLFNKGESFGFECTLLENHDLSLLCSAVCIIITSYSERAQAAQKFACEHGIPLVWYHKTGAPEDRKSWHFKQTLVGEFSKHRFWSCICQIVQQ